MRENREWNNSEYGHFLRSLRFVFILFGLDMVISRQLTANQSVQREHEPTVNVWYAHVLRVCIGKLQYVNIQKFYVKGTLMQIWKSRNPFVFI